MEANERQLSSHQVDAAIAEYLDAINRDAPPNHEEFLARHQEVAAELVEFLKDHAALGAAAKLLHSEASTDHDPASTGRPARTSLKPIACPFRFGNFELIEEIARGGMGIVYRARQLKPERVVALKMILTGQLASHSDISRFYAEAQAAAALDHPSIVPIFEVGECEGQHYFTMALVEGESLAQRLMGGPLAAREAAAIVRDVTLAVEFAHQHGVIHRDLKPANILFDASGRVRVSDFGLAKQQTEQASLTNTGQILGTPCFMSPEQAKGDPSRIGRASDVYALGATLYALVTGRPPFQAASTIDTLKQVVEQDPVSPRQLNATIPLDIETIALKCLEKPADRRYTSAQDLAEELDRFLNGKPIHARPVSRSEHLWRWCRRNPVVSALAAAVFAALTCGIIGTTIGLLGESRQRELAEQSRNAAQHQEQEANKQAAVAEAVNRFFAEVLSSANPEKLGQRATVLDAVMSAAKELDAGRLRDQPLVEASVRSAIGQSLRGLGRYEEALSNYQRAVDLCRKNLPAGDPDIAWNLNDVANTLRDLQRLDEAENAASEALAIRRKALSAADPNISTSLSTFASVLFDKGRYAEAEKLQREAIALARNGGASNARDVVILQLSLGQILTSLGKLDESEKVLREALQSCQTAFPRKHPVTAKTLNAMAMLLDDQGRAPEAEKYYREALEILREIQPAGHRDIAACQSNLALTLKAQNKYAEAESNFRDALDILRRALPEGHPELAACLHNMSLVQYQQRKYVEAEQLCRECIAILSKTVPEGDLRLAFAKTSLAAALESQKKYTEAEECFRSALVSLERGLGKPHVRVGFARLGLGKLLTKVDRLPEAEAELLEAEKTLGAAQGDRTFHEDCFPALVALYERWNEREPGKGYAEKARDWRSKSSQKLVMPANSAP
jgi:serine/threonine protein kinase